jgi:hypothetical protein
MGWWKVQGTDNMIGDLPLDAIGGAASQVVAEYQRAFGRRPTSAEWQALLATVMGAEEPEYQCFSDIVGPIDVIIQSRK